MSSEKNKEIVSSMWACLYKKDFDGVASYIAEDGFYEDVPTPDNGARGPKNVVARLRSGLDYVERFEHDVHRMVAEGDSVLIEHTETWHFPKGEVLTNKFVTVHELRDGKISLWRDYWDLTAMMNQAPQWWLEKLAKHQSDEWA